MIDLWDNKNHFKQELSLSFFESSYLTPFVLFSLCWFGVPAVTIVVAAVQSGSCSTGLGSGCCGALPMSEMYPKAAEQTR